MEDIGGWLLLGIVIAGTITYFVPESFFTQYKDYEFVSLIIMLLAGIPLYVCASASTPIAAALVLKGVSPGAAIVLLLAGPATNAATITVIIRILGRRLATVYVVCIAVCSLAFGWFVNRLYQLGRFSTDSWIAGTGESFVRTIGAIAAVVLIVLVSRALLSKFRQRTSFPPATLKTLPRKLSRTDEHPL